MKKKILFLCSMFLLLTFSVAFVGCSEEPHTHNYHSVITDATCTENGFTTYTCECGDFYVESYTEKIGHNYEYFSVSPTCTLDGYTGKYCLNCGEIVKGDVINKLNHNFILQSIIVSGGEVHNAGEYQCSICLEEKVDTIKFQDVNLPILSLVGDISGMTKDNKVTVAVNYTDGSQEIECDATLKWQGASSISYPKKNYSIQLLKKGSDKKNKVELDSDWGEQSKYCLKANYVDYSQSRNVVSGQIYNEIVHSRDLNDEVEALKYGGVVDGFPIIIFINGEYQGLYTLNIPKDKWMLGMDDDEEGDEVVTKQAILMGDTWSNAVSLKEPISNDYISSGFELEYCSTEDTIGDEWIVESFNNMINFINNNDGQDFINGISDYVNIERTIDSMIYTWFIIAGDNTSKNILWVTYDGIHWFSSMYDMDGTWGLVWNGSLGYSPENSYINILSGNELWKKIYNNFHDEVVKMN